MIAISIAVLLTLCVFAMFKWRIGLILAVTVALLQDPARKLAPESPVYFVVFVGVVFIAAWIGAWVDRVKLGPQVIHGWQQNLKTPTVLFAATLVLQAMHSLARWENAVLPAIGLVFYVAPVLAVVFAHQFAQRVGARGIRQFLWFYVGASLLWFLGVLAEANGISSPMLGEVGVGQFIYSFGLNKKAASGFYRAAEVAAWHIATVSCCLFILLNGRGFSVFKSLLVVALVTYLMYVGFATGRRKMLVYVVIFAGVYVALFAWFLRGKARLAVFGLVVAAVLFGALLGLGPDVGERGFDRVERNLGQTDAQAAWVERGLTVFGDIPGRFQLLAYRPVEWAIDSFGWFGAGLGTGAQGAQHFGGGAVVFGGAAEGGLGKITMDLGVPGLLLFVWLIFAVMQQIWQRLHALSRASRPHATLAFGLVALLMANVASFAIATQVYGDVFVLLILGWSIGFLLALPAVAYQESQLHSRAGATKRGHATVGAIGVAPIGRY